MYQKEASKQGCMGQSKEQTSFQILILSNHSQGKKLRATVESSHMLVSLILWIKFMHKFCGGQQGWEWILDFLIHVEAAYISRCPIQTAPDKYLVKASKQIHWQEFPTIRKAIRDSLQEAPIFFNNCLKAYIICGSVGKSKWHLTFHSILHGYMP